MVVQIALEIILQPIKVFPSIQNKNSENFQNSEITPSTKFNTESIYKTCHLPYVIAKTNQETHEKVATCAQETCI